MSILAKCGRILMAVRLHEDMPAIWQDLPYGRTSDKGIWGSRFSCNRNCAGLVASAAIQFHRAGITFAIQLDNLNHNLFLTAQFLLPLGFSLSLACLDGLVR